MYFDAHNHLQDDWLTPWRSEILRDLPALRIRGMVVNGTGEDDWADVESLAAEHSEIIPSYGVHPWHVDEVTPEWKERLEAHLDRGGLVGEIGLDRWKTNRNFDQQIEIFRYQIGVATERNLPATIHCLRAWGALWDLVRMNPMPGRGFLLHAYGGPVEMIDGFVSRGAYFSFSGSFLAKGRERKLEPFRVLPLDRLLVETDAPAMPLAEEIDRHPLPLAPDGTRINHPANLLAAYEGLAATRGLPLDELVEIVAENYARLFVG
jgi:TatD DNase family protein